MREFNPSPEFEEKVREAVSAPSARPEFVNQLRNELARRPVKMKSRFVLKPAWVIAIVLLIAILVISAPQVVAALKQLFGYVPGVGLVETTSGLRELAEPVSITREGVTLTIKYVLVYEDHVILEYEVNGVHQSYEHKPGTCGADQPAGSFWSDADADLRLPDGTVIRRDYAGKYQFENRYGFKPIYAVNLPPDVTELTFLLKCIYGVKLGSAPENWEVPLKIKYVPEGTSIGEPVLGVTPSGKSSVAEQGITISLEKVVPQRDKYSFYFSIIPEKKDESLLALYPASAYLIDATGQEIYLSYMGPWYDNKSNLWELQTTSKPAYGPYTLVIDKLFAYYETDYNRTNNASFEFDPGQNPQIGQTWTLNETFSLGGIKVNVISAKMVEKDLSAWGLSKNTQGIEFSFQSADAITPIHLEILDNAEHIMDGQVITDNEYSEASVDFSAALYYEKGLPKDKIPVTIWEGYIPISGKWGFQWNSPDQTGVNLLDVVHTISSKPGTSGVMAELKRVVKLNDGFLFYIHMAALEKKPDFRVIEPVEVFVIDSTGHKIKLNLDGPQIYNAREENLLQFSTREKIVDGPIKIVIEKAKVHYTNFNFDSPPAEDVLQRAIDEHSFIFDVGADPKIDQVWILDEEFEIGGYEGKVLSARAVSIDYHLLPYPNLQVDESINRGYEFTIEALDPGIQWNVNMFIYKPKGEGYADCIGGIDGELGSITTHTVTCRGLFNDKLQATLTEISILLDEVWEIDWNLPAQ